MIEEICPECQKRLQVPAAEWQEMCSYFHVDCVEESGSGDEGEYIWKWPHDIFNGDLIAGGTIIFTNEFSFIGIEPIQ